MKTHPLPFRATKVALKNKFSFCSFILFSLLLFSLSVSAQVADSVYYERLYYTCKVWGHAKYYHSRIAEGKVNWDNVLLNALSGIKNAPNNQAFNDSLLVMLQQAGETEAGIELLPEVPDSLNNNLDLSWIYHPIFSNEVSALLDTIMQRFTPRPNVYVKPSAINAPDFSSDDTYSSVGLVVNEFRRILAVFRYWNIIHYFYPYKHIMDQDWETTLKQIIPTVVEASNAVEYHLAMRVFTAKINDSHAFFSSNTYFDWRGQQCPPFIARWIEEEVVITKVHSTISSLHKGDIITKIDGFNIVVLRDSLRKFSYGSNEISIEKNLIDMILWGDIGSFSLTVLNETGERTLTLFRNYDTYYSELYQDNTPYWRETTLNGCRFGIVHMGNLTNAHFPDIIDKFHTVDAIIFDIRNYPNGTLWSFANYLFEEPLYIANFTYPDINYPGRLFWEPEVIGEGNTNPVRKKIMILFDERTLSQAEYTCMGLGQIPGAIKIGSTTAAADGNISYIYLPGGISTIATFLGTYYPDYTPTQRIGIIPDYEVRPTIQGIREGRDEVLEFALNCDFVGIENMTKEEGILVYPNPTTGDLRIEISDMRYETLDMRYEIFDIYGRKMAQVSNLTSQVSNHLIVSSSNHLINISHLPAGVYFVKICTEAGIITKKVIKY